jgi:hypothetical protein
MQQRTETACCDVATGILTESPTTPDHTNRLNWAKYCYSAPATVMQQAIWYVVMDPTVNAAGTACTDANIKAAVTNNLSYLTPLAPTTAGIGLAMIAPPAPYVAPQTTGS